MRRLFTRRRIVRGLLAVVAALVAGPLVAREGWKWSGGRRLDRAAAALDAAEPWWRLGGLVEAHNASITPADRSAVAALRAAIAAFPERWTEFDVEKANNFLDLTRPSNRRPDDRAVAAFGDAIDGHRPASQAAAALIDRSGGEVELRLDDDGMGVRLAGESFDVGRVVTWERAAAVVAALRGDPTAAVRHLRAALAATRMIGRVPTPFAQHARLRQAAETAETVVRVLGLSEPTAGLSELQADLRAEADHPHYPLALKGARATVYRRLSALAAGELPLDDMVRKEWVHGDARGNDRPVYWYLKAFAAADAADCLRHSTALIAAAGRPLGERAAALAAVPPVPEDLAHIYSSRMFSMVWEWRVDKTMELQAVIQIGIAALACEQHRRATGTWPATLAEIPAGILGPPPIDVYTGRPVLVRRVGDGLQVYSVGANKTDDFEAFTANPDYLNLSNKRDLGFRLWNPDHRGLPPVPAP